jgi:hypothetical protein
VEKWRFCCDDGFWVEILGETMEAVMSQRQRRTAAVAIQLNAEQEAQAQRLAATIAAKTQEEVLRMTRLLVSKKDHEIFGETEFQIRDIVHKIGANAIEAALNERKKGATKDPA